MSISTLQALEQIVNDVVSNMPNKQLDSLAKDIIYFILRCMSKGIVIEPPVFSGMDVAVVRLLISSQAQNIYFTGSVIFENLKLLNIAMIKIFTLWDAESFFKKGYAHFDELKDLPPEVVECLISHKARMAYDTGKITVKDLIGLDLATINFMISDFAMRQYTKENLPVESVLIYFRSLNPETSVMLTSKETMSLCNTFSMTIDELKNFSAPVLQYLLSHDVLRTISSRKQEAINNFQGLSVETIRALVDMMRDTHNRDTRDIKVRDVLEVSRDPAIINLVTSERALEIYRYGVITLPDLKDVDPKILQCLFTYDGLLACRNGLLRKDHLNSLNKETMAALLACISTLVYTYEADALRSFIDDMKDLDLPTLKFFSDNFEKFQWAYDNSLLDFNANRKIDTELLEFLSLPVVEQAYSIYLLRDNDPCFYDSEGREKILLLMSEPMASIFRKETINPVILKDLSLPVIQLFLEYEQKSNGKMLSSYEDKHDSFSRDAFFKELVTLSLNESKARFVELTEETCSKTASPLLMQFRGVRQPSAGAEEGVDERTVVKPGPR